MISRSESREASRGDSRNGTRRRAMDQLRANGAGSAPPTRQSEQVSNWLDTPTQFPPAPLTEPAYGDGRPSRSMVRDLSTDQLLTPGPISRTKVPRPKRSRERQGA